MKLYRGSCCAYSENEALEFVKTLQNNQPKELGLAFYLTPTMQLAKTYAIRTALKAIETYPSGMWDINITPIEWPTISMYSLDTKKEGKALADVVRDYTDYPLDKFLRIVSENLNATGHNKIPECCLKAHNEAVQKNFNQECFACSEKRMSFVLQNCKILCCSKFSLQEFRGDNNRIK